jgi:hypothetical protein
MRRPAWAIECALAIEELSRRRFGRHHRRSPQFALQQSHLQVWPEEQEKYLTPLAKEKISA